MRYRVFRKDRFWYVQDTLSDREFGPFAAVEAAERKAEVLSST